MTHDHPSPVDVAERLAHEARAGLRPWSTAPRDLLTTASDLLLSQAGEIERLRGHLEDVTTPLSAIKRVTAQRWITGAQTQALRPQVHEIATDALHTVSAALQGDGG